MRALGVALRLKRFRAHDQETRARQSGHGRRHFKRMVELRLTVVVKQGLILMLAANVGSSTAAIFTMILLRIDAATNGYGAQSPASCPRQ
jgi:hypothetical protein